ncbi:MAG: NAD(P)-dependent oxidoreductase, partial [Bacteroidota bacterium]
FSSPEGNADAVGEHCMALLLALSNKIVLANNSVKNLEWNREAHRGFEIKAKTVGIIGYGNMGKAFAQRLTGFDCSVLAYDKYLKNYGNEFAIESSLTDIYRDADIVSLHLPLSAETWNYANDNFFNNFRKKIVFLNTARGNHVEINSLIRAIKSGKISHCGLDVLPFEKQSLEDINRNDELEELLSFPNVVVTPHVAGWTTESYEKLSRVLGEKILKAYS